MNLADGLIHKCLKLIGYVETNQLDKELCEEVIVFLRFLTIIFARMSHEEIDELFTKTQKVYSKDIDVSQAKELIDKIIQKVNME